MIKLKTIGMIEKNAKNDPTVKAHTELKNGAIHTVTNGLTVYPILGTPTAPQTKDLRIALNTAVGDNRYVDVKIPADNFVNSFLIRAWDTQEFVFDESHITYGSGESYDNVVVGSTKLIAGIDGNFAIATDTTNYGIYFEVTQKLQFNGNGLAAKIVVA